jgi:hypothetical protein
MGMFPPPFTGEEASKAMLDGLISRVREGLRQRILESIEPDITAAAFSSGRAVNHIAFDRFVSKQARRPVHSQGEIMSPETWNSSPANSLGRCPRARSAASGSSRAAARSSSIAGCDRIRRAALEWFWPVMLAGASFGLGYICGGCAQRGSGGLALSHEDALNELDERPGTDDQA